MTRLAVIVRDRKTGRPRKVRVRTEPVKLRVCRDCYRTHVIAAKVCKQAA
jgi:hypothetical protein